MLKDRPMAVALAVSTIFHVSMVTVFSIGVWFEIEPVRYFEFEIKAQQPGGSARSDPGFAPRQVLQVPSLDGSGHNGPDLPPGEGVLTISDPAARAPDIELPTLFAADMARLELTRRSLEIRTQQAGLFREPREDSWARFGEEVLQLRQALLRLPLFGDEQAPGDSQRMQRVSEPAPGYAVYIEWLTEPYDRELLFSPPVQALWNLDASSLPEPVSFVFRVSPDGRVREVLDTGGIADPDLTASVGRALVNYRFTPLPPGGTDDQTGTLMLARESDEADDATTTGVLTLP
jgi:hypothetical protein